MFHRVPNISLFTDGEEQRPETLSHCSVNFPKSHNLFNGQKAKFLLMQFFSKFDQTNCYRQMFFIFFRVLDMILLKPYKYEKLYLSKWVFFFTHVKVSRESKVKQKILAVPKIMPRKFMNDLEFFEFFELFEKIFWVITKKC